jgi:hypothetical protein
MTARLTYSVGTNLFNKVVLHFLEKERTERNEKYTEGIKRI